MGRPPKSGSRHKCGKLKVPKDYGTPESIMKRQRLVGSGDPVRSHYQLGVLLETGAITEEQHQAGLEYARAFRIAGGHYRWPAMIRANGALSRLMPDDHGTIPEDVVEIETAKWRSVCRRLKRYSPLVKAVVDNVALYNQWDSRARHVIHLGLDVILRNHLRSA